MGNTGQREVQGGLFFFIYFFVNYCVLGEDLDHNISMILRYYLITSRVRLAVVCGPDRVVGDSSYWKTTMIRCFENRAV